MQYVVYVLAGISILLAIGGLEAYRSTRNPGLLLSSVISILFALLAITLGHWWPLAAGFLANWGLRLLGLDPSWRR
jgi:hypothetical protein